MNTSAICALIGGGIGITYIIMINSIAMYVSKKRPNFDQSSFLMRAYVLALLLLVGIFILGR